MGIEPLFCTIISTLILILLTPQVIVGFKVRAPGIFFAGSLFPDDQPFNRGFLVKGPMAGMFGLLLSTIGMDLISGYVRLTLVYICSGRHALLVVLIGGFLPVVGVNWAIFVRRGRRRG